MTNKDKETLIKSVQSGSLDETQKEALIKIINEGPDEKQKESIIKTIKDSKDFSSLLIKLFRYGKIVKSLLELSGTDLGFDFGEEPEDDVPDCNK